MKRAIKLLSAFAAMCQASVALAADRVELPVRLVQLSDGTRRFGVPLTIDGHPVEAGLDTGSTGLRVMARAMPGNTAGGAPAHYGYGSGTQLDGPVVTSTVAFGPLSGAIKVQRVDALSCLPGHSQCPVKRNGDLATFGIQGNGLPNEGFPAILGVNLRPAGAPNAFEALGARRWIVELPRPGDTAPGRIILNPDDADIAGFANYRLLDDDNSLAACITGPAPLERVCGPATLDSGAPGLRVVEAHGRAPIPNGTSVTIALGDAKSQTTAALVTGQRDQASRLTLEQGPDSTQPKLFFGVAPYWRWSVLYDADAHTIGLKPR